MGFLPDITLAQTGNAVVALAPGTTGPGNIDGEAPDGSFEQLLDAAVGTALQGETQGGEAEVDDVVTPIHSGATLEDDVAILSLLQPVAEAGDLIKGLAVAALVDESGDTLAKEHGSIVGMREGAVVFQSVRVGSLGGNAEIVDTEVSPVTTTPVASQLASVDEADELLVRVQTAVMIPSDGKASVIVQPVPQQVVSVEGPASRVSEHGTPAGIRPSVLAFSTEGIDDIQPQVRLAENLAQSENQGKPVTTLVSPSASSVAQKMTTNLNVATAGHVLEAPKGELALSTSLAGSHDESDGQPHPQGKPFVATKPQAGFINVDTSEAESLLPTEFSVIARNAKISEPDMVQQPARVDPQKTLGMTPVENVQDSRGVSHVNRGPLTPMTDLSDGIQRVEQAMKMSAVTNQQGVRLQLDPPDLGRLVVNLNVHDQRVTTAMITDHPLVRDILVANQHRLESSLQEQGLRMQEFSVDLGRRSLDLRDEASHGGERATSGEETDDSTEETTSEHREEHNTALEGLNLFA